MSRPTMTKNQYVAGMRAAMMASGMAARRTHNGLLFTEDDWQQVNFKHSTFSRCDWYEEDADFSESTFHMAEFDDVEMAGGTFRYVNFDSALFTKCTMDRATIDGAGTKKHVLRRMQSARRTFPKLQDITRLVPRLRSTGSVVF